MYRDAEDYLIKWYQNPKRKPLIIRGARQVGKSYLVRKWSKDHNRDLIEINFEQSPEIGDLFDSMNPKKILSLLEMHFGRKITANSSLIFLDEIQAAPKLIQALRYFYEQSPEVPIIAAGSLLEFVLGNHQFSMPVGRIEYLHLEPMNFCEFLRAVDKESYASFIANYSSKEEISEFVHNELMKLIKTYCIIGGMPEVVEAYRTTKSPQSCVPIQESILVTYRDDFAKYAKKSAKPEILRKTYQQVPTMVGTKFIYSRVDRDIRPNDIKSALELLCNARVVHKVVHSDGNGVPLGAETEEKDFKVLFLDIGLLCRSLKLDLLGIETISELDLINAGSVAEQLAGQLIRNVREFYEEPGLYCWIRQKKQSSAEVDYLFTVRQQVIPIEIKAGKTGTLKSLQSFVREKRSPLAVRFNSMPPSLVETKTSLVGEAVPFNLLSLPFYLISKLPDIVKGI